MRILGRRYEERIANQLMGIAMFFASASISFMLLLTGQEFMVEAIVWFLISVARPLFGHLIVHEYIKLPLRKPQPSTDA